MKKVASVTMKLGSFVFTTIIPLMKPIVAAKTNVSTIANQMFMSSSVASRPITSPALPVITPADRSNSPPIMSSATATAGMPSVEATSVQLAAPSSVPNSSVVKREEEEDDECGERRTRARAAAAASSRS